jgi:hypothetical protein
LIVLQNEGILLANSKVPKYGCPTYLLILLANPHVPKLVCPTCLL